MPGHASARTAQGAGQGTHGRDGPRRSETVSRNDVMSGVFYIGVGERFDGAKSGEYVTQVTAMGPISLDYLNPADDPRNASD
jgi:hypothetical protein